MTFGSGRVVLGALRVYWYARVSIAMPGKSADTFAAIALMARRSGPLGAPPSASMIACSAGVLQ